MKKIYALILAFTMLFSLNAVAEEAKGERLEIYVDVNAEASGDGSFSSPLKTVAEAQAKVREVIASDNYPSGGIVVFLREGTYTLSDTVYFGEEDSGKENAPVVWRAYYNEEVIVTNSASIPLSEFSYSDDERIPESAQGKILSYNLKEHGIDGYDGLYIGGHSQHFYWQFGMAEEDAIQFGYSAPEIFYGDENGRLAQYPNGDEWLGITELVEPGTPAWWIDDHNGTHLDSWVGTTVKVNVEKKRMQRWANAKNPWFDSYWCVDWSDFRAPWAEIDPVNQTMTMVHSSPYKPVVGKARWRIYNLIEELDDAGEWFYDVDNGELYIFPPAGVKQDENITLCFHKKNIFELKNAHDIVIRDLNIQGTRFSGISGTGLNRIEIAYNHISKVSSAGIEAHGNNLYIHGNIIENIGARGINCSGGNKETLEASNNLIENNYITNFARLQKSYIGGVALGGVGITVRNNSISEAPQLAISFGGNDHLIERNDIHDVLKEASDMGAAYCYMGYDGRGTVFKNNAFHDLKTNSTDSIGLYTIYFDGGSSGHSAIGNVIYNVEGSGIFANTGSYHTLKNNVFANITGDGIYFAAVKGRTQELNKSLDGADDYKDNQAYSKYPGFLEMFDDPDHWTTTKGCVVDDNIGYNVGKKVATYTLGASQMTYDMMQTWNSFEEGVSLSDDSDFLSASNNNYTLLETSKIFERMPSFKEAGIDMSKMGTLTGMWEHYIGENSLVYKKNCRIAFVDFEEELRDESPVKYIDGKAYIPLRYSYEGMNYPVSWNAETNGINIETKLLELSFKLDSTECVKNGEEKTLKNKILRDENGVTWISVEDFAEITNLSLYTTDDGLYIFSEKDLSGVIYDDMLKDLNERLEM